MKIAFIIGCNKYDDPDITNLEYADKDACLVYKEMASNCGLSNEEMVLLSSSRENNNYHPTRSNIVRELSKCANISADLPINLLYFFFSGHGFHSSNDGNDYLIPKDAVVTSLEYTSLTFPSIIAFLEKWNAQNIILFIDACRSPVEGGKGIPVKQWEALHIQSICPEGMVAFFSCSPQQKSYEAAKIENGIFTYGLCESLGNTGKCKTVYEVNQYLVNRIPNLCKEFSKPPQMPYTRVEPLSLQDMVLISEEKLREWRSQTPIGKELRKKWVEPSKISYSKDYLICAIDFGTSFSAISVLDGDKKVLLLPSSERKFLVPSVVSFLSNMDYVVGWEAMENAKISPDKTIFNIKRLLGSKITKNIEGKSMTPEFIASLIIASLKKNAEEYLSTKIDKVLASVPANFSINQANALSKAFELADFKVIRLIGEPCAASLVLSTDHDFRAMIIDLGGGTFDISLMEYGEGIIESCAITGDNNLGGIDYDNAIYEYILSQVQDKMKNPLFTLHEVDKSQIRFEAERLKIALSSCNQSTAILQNIEVENYDFKNIEIPINRDLFRKLTDNINKKIERCIKRVLEMDDHREEKLRYYGLDYILLAGQGSKLFTVREVIERLISERFEKKIPIIDSYQESAVVYGLCTYTGVLMGFRKDLLLIDTNYRGIGIKCKEIFDEEGEGPDVIISPKENENTKTYELMSLNTTIPTFNFGRTAAWEKLEGKITLPIKFVEIDAEKGEDAESFIGKVDIEVQGNAKPLTIYLDCDTNRTIVVSIANPTNKKIENYQLNNFYYPAEDLRQSSLIRRPEFGIEKIKRI